MGPTPVTETFFAPQVCPVSTVLESFQCTLILEQRSSQTPIFWLDFLTAAIGFKPQYVFGSIMYFSVENQTTLSESFFVSHLFSGIKISLRSVNKPLVTEDNFHNLYVSFAGGCLCFVLFSTKLWYLWMDSSGVQQQLNLLKHKLECKYVPFSQPIPNQTDKPR